MTPSPSLAIALGLVALSLQPTPQPDGCPKDGWNPRILRSVNVKNINELVDAVRSAKVGDAILLADGDYPLRGMLDLAVPHVTLRGRNGDPAKVVIHGRGMTGDNVGVAISVSAPNVSVADVTIRDVGYHAVQVRGEQAASAFTLYNARLQDTGQQLLKGSLADNHQVADDGLVACSEFSFTTSAPSDYTNGVDIIGTKGWTIRDNRFIRIRGPESRGWKSSPAILAWGAAEDTLVERNVIIDSFRGIALGLAAGTASSRRNGERAYDHLRGVVRNNVIVNLNNWADEAIEANDARDVRIEHNTVLVESAASPWSIGIRFSSSALVRNNLTNLQVLLRDGGRATLEGNVTTATRGWFVNPARADLHLLPGARRTLKAGVPNTDVTEDFDRKIRSTKGPDVGAFEAGPGRDGAKQ
jgi:hypothetical protein